MLLLLLGAVARSAPPTTRPVPAIQRVLIISIDGLRSDVLLRAEALTIHDLYRSGSFSFWAKTTAASITLPSHVSMFTGVTPEAHAILWNGDLPLAKPVYPTAPTIFELAHRAGYSTAMVAGKSKLSVLDKPGTLDWKWYPDQPKCEDAEVTAAATSILREHQPQLMFVHLPGVDNVGHAKGWGSDEQLEAVKQADACVGQLLATIREQKLDSETLVILTSDHGGAGRTHGPEDARSRTIPWILSGPGVRKNFDLTRLGHEHDVETYDTFATACAVLGIPVTRRIDGKFVHQAFDTENLMLSTYQPSMQPTTKPESEQ